MAVIRLRKCMYHGQACFVRRDNQDGTVTLVHDAYPWVISDGGWTRVDKFEWEKTVPTSDITLLPDDASDKGA